MEEEKFRDYLIKKGKKEHVVRQLIGSVRLFEDYLKTQKNTTIDKATDRNIRDYSEICVVEKKGSVKIVMRGIAYYYEFIGNEKISALAAEIRDN
ncbi:MAG: hypothetical protein P8105_11835, partial [Dehalococcoidia bacterium]